jgi:CBS domain-containing protein
MITVRHLLEKKGHNIETVGPNATVYDAIKKMADLNIGSLVVMHGDDIIGMITERHYARDVILKGKTSPDTLVEEIMEVHLVYAQPEHSVEECMVEMTNKAVRHLPVREEGRIVGVISIGDLVRSIIDDQKHTIEQLEHYIGG